MRQDTDEHDAAAVLDGIDCLVWDWNGTLLDDVQLCVDALNALCAKRNLPRVSLQEYRDTFTFPVIEYYRSVGFDFVAEPFHGPAQEWIAFYAGRVSVDAGLFASARPALEWARAKGLRQIMLSAHQKDMLIHLMREFGVSSYFETILGLDDFDAQSKLEVGRAWLAQSGIKPQSALLIGDTLHDHEVAQALGLPCVLLAQGHQSRERLLATGAPVLDGIGDVPRFVEANAGRIGQGSR